MSTEGRELSGWPQEEAWNGKTFDVEFRLYQPDSFPFTLYSCPVCAALVPDGEQWVHQEWHEATDLSAPARVRSPDESVREADCDG